MVDLSIVMLNYQRVIPRKNKKTHVPTLVPKRFTAWHQHRRRPHRSRRRHRTRSLWRCEAEAMEGQEGHGGHEPWRHQVWCTI